MEITRVGTFTTSWGESLVWDDIRDRLYFADCMASTVHWLEADSDELHTMAMPSMATGIVPTEDGALVVVLEDGLYRCDVDADTVELISLFPDAIGGRCNDACADLDGNIITGKLNLEPAEGSTWQYSRTGDWTLLDPDIANTNGPAAMEIDGRSILVIGDTSANYWAYDYDAAAATVGERWVFGDTNDLDGGPDGTTVDGDNGLWCALVQGGRLLRFTLDGLTDSIPLPVNLPTDVTFGGPNLDRLYVTTISGENELDGALLVIDGLDFTGRLEPRANLAT